MLGESDVGHENEMSQEKVLIVEDEENERTGLAELVSSWGFRVETARDGVEGLERARQWTPSIVVTDLKMPRMGGIDLLGHLAEQTQTMAVVLVTAQGTIDSGPINSYSLICSLSPLIMLSVAAFCSLILARSF